MHQYHLHNRPDREITDPATIDEILTNGKFATIALCRNNEPYIVTLSYGYDRINQTLYFHCAPTGLKIDFIEMNSAVCITIIEDGGYVRGECAHHFRSVVMWGNLVKTENPDEQRHGMKTLLHHLEPDNDVAAQKLAKSEAFYQRMEILKFEIAQLHAKAGK